MISMNLLSTRFRNLSRPILLLNRCTRTTLRSNSNSGLFAEYRFALTRRIDPSLAKNALRIGGSDVGEIDMTAALDQHQKLVGAMQSIGLQIFELPSDGCADSVFIEDTVVIVGKTAMITNPGAVSRRAETVGVKRFLETSQDFLLQVVQQSEGHLDGGDVLFTGNEFFVGLSKRTDQDGINCLARTFPEYRVTPICINDFSSKTLHLKSACSVCGPNHILVGGELGKIIATAIDSSSPGTYKFTHVVDEEAANCVYTNGTLIRRTKEEFPNSADGLKSIGGKQIEIRASELAKVDAALTCCSVLF